MKSLILLINELFDLGIKGALWRIWFEFKRRSVIAPFLNILFIKIKQKIFLGQLDINYVTFGIIGRKKSSYFYKDENLNLIDEANNILEFKFTRFSNEIIELKSFDWFYEPESNIYWPSSISSERLLLEADKFGDIKLIWEITRFSWLMTLARAYLVSDNEEYLYFGLKAINSFYSKNPIGKGPHWCSEQEVAIRSYNILWFFDLCNSNINLSSEHKKNCISLLHLHYCYIKSHLSYAKNAIRNNHLIHALVAILAISKFLNLNNKAIYNNAERDLITSINEQWYSDGGYVQPSFIYHRSADYGLIFLRNFLVPGEDLDLLIIKTLEESSNFLGSFINMKTGLMPNWGANDGSRIFYLSDEYLDFRPLLSIISIISSTSTPFLDKGSLSEISLLFDISKEEIEHIKDSAESNFIKLRRIQGVHSISDTSNNIDILFRCGSINSRYALHADQLHIDLSMQESQVFQGSGSYNYNKDINAHNYFRGTKSKNTITINDESQMIHHRKFKFLQWTSSTLLTSRVDLGKNFLIGGLHDGYLKTRNNAIHARLFYRSFDGSILILDKIWSTKSEPLKNIEMSFNLNADLNFVNNRSQVFLEELKSRITFLGSSLINFENKEVFNSNNKYYEDNISLHYNNLKKTNKLKILSTDTSEIYMLTFIEFEKEGLKNNHQSFEQILTREDINLDKVDTYLKNINLGS